MCCFVLIFSLSSYQRWKYLVEWAVGHQTANIHWGEKIKVSRAREVRCRHAFSQESPSLGAVCDCADYYLTLLPNTCCVCVRVCVTGRGQSTDVINLITCLWVTMHGCLFLELQASNP